MDQQSTNPYAPPTADTSEPTTVRSTSELRPLWIWLGIAVVISFFGTPADPMSMLMALAYGLVSFGVGSILGSSLHVMLRVLPLVLWAAPVVWLALSFGDPYHIAGASFYALVSIVNGTWASCSIQRGRLRILASFCGGYVLGSLVGILGTVAGAVLATILAKRSLRVQNMPGSG